MSSGCKFPKCIDVTAVSDDGKGAVDASPVGFGQQGIQDVSSLVGDASLSLFLSWKRLIGPQRQVDQQRLQHVCIIFDHMAE